MLEALCCATTYEKVSMKKLDRRPGAASLPPCSHACSPVSTAGGLPLFECMQHENTAVKVQEVFMRRCNQTL